MALKRFLAKTLAVISIIHVDRKEQDANNG